MKRKIYHITRVNSKLITNSYLSFTVFRLICGRRPTSPAVVRIFYYHFFLLGEGISKIVSKINITHDMYYKFGLNKGGIDGDKKYRKV